MIKLFPWFASSRLAELAAQTPASRDRYVDFLRAFSITVVVIGHWISAVVLIGDNGIKVYNAVGAIPGTWVTTWVLQVMPLFFFVGGFSNLVSLDAFKRRGEPVSAFLRTRAVRLLKPTSIFLGVWFFIFVLLTVLFKVETQVAKASILVLGPLWFLGVYLIVTLVAPLMRELHRRYRVWLLVIPVVLTILIDLLHFWLKIPAVKWANVAFVWFFVHQLGFFYADGSLTRAPKRAHIAMTLGSLGCLLVLTNIGVYPKSMVGTGLEKVSNMSPPTVCIVVLTCWLVGAAMLLRDPLNRWLARQRPWMAVILANSMIMTLYLWHLTAYAIAFLLFYLIGFGCKAVGTPLWWLQRPVWIVVSAIILMGILRIFARFERPARRKKP